MIQKELNRLLALKVLTQEEYANIMERNSKQQSVQKEQKASRVLDGYKLYLENNFTKNTCSSYGNTAKQLLDYLFGGCLDESVNGIEFENIKNWVEYLFKEGYSENAIRRHLNGVKNLFGYLSENGIKVPNIDSIKMHEDNKLSIEFNALSDSVVREIISCSQSVRDEAMLTFMYETTMKRQELLDCKLSHINWNNNTVEIIKEEKVDRVGYFSNETKALLQEYLTQLANEIEETNENRKLKGNNNLIEPSEYLFRTLKSNKMSYAVIVKALKVALEEYNSANKDTPVAEFTTETLRNSRRAFYFSEGLSVKEVQVLVGDEHYWRCERFYKVSQKLYPNKFADCTL